MGACCAKASVGIIQTCLRIEAVLTPDISYLGVVWYVLRTDAGRIVVAISTSHTVVLGRLGACTPAAAGGSESTGTQGVENVEHERIFFRCKVKDPEDIDEREDQPAGRHGVHGGFIGGKDACVDAMNGVNGGKSPEYSYLETVHGDGVAGESIEDAKDKEELEKDAEPESAHGDMSIYTAVSQRRRGGRDAYSVQWK